MTEQHYKAACYAILAIANFSIAFKSNNKGGVISGAVSGIFLAQFLHTIQQL